jgi:hypothetical protein
VRGFILHLGENLEGGNPGPNTPTRLGVHASYEFQIRHRVLSQTFLATGESDHPSAYKIYFTGSAKLGYVSGWGTGGVVSWGVVLAAVSLWLGGGGYSQGVFYAHGGVGLWFF